MRCKHCASRCRAYGKNPSGTRRYQCVRCRRTQSEPRRAVGNMYLPFEKACRTAELLVEGCSVRSAARLSGLPRCTVLALAANAGRACHGLLRSRIRGVDVDHLELAEQRQRLGRLKGRADGLSKALKQAAGQLEARARGNPEPPSVRGSLECPEAGDVTDTYRGIGDAKERIRAAGERLKQLGVALG